MSDPIASVPYEPNAAPAPAPLEPAGGDPSRLQAAIAADLEPWQRNLAGRITRQNLDGLRDVVSTLGTAAQHTSRILGSDNWYAVIDELNTSRARVSRTWSEYHRRRS